MANKFTNNKYKKNTYKKSIPAPPYVKEVEFPFADGTDAQANLAEMVVSFEHVPSKTKIYFKAFITAFNETYNSDWSTETVFGRVDPLYLFGQTEKRISLAFKVPAATESEAYENLGNVQTLAQFLYPTYTNPSSATTISQGPQIRLKVMNLLAMHATSEMAVPQSRDTLTGESWLYNRYGQAADGDGMLGYMSSLVINHNLENSSIGVIEKSPNTILPKMIDINIEFSPVHERTLGWDEKGKSKDPASPYGIVLGHVPSSRSSPPPTAGGDAIIHDHEKEQNPEPDIDPEAPPPPPANTATSDAAGALRQRALSSFHRGCQKRDGLTQMSAVARRVDCFKDGESLAHFHTDQPGELHGFHERPGHVHSKDLPE